MIPRAAFNTVAAISTPPGKGGVAVIRMSGDGAIAIAERCFSARSGMRISALPERTAIYGDILSGGEPIDDGVLTVFRAPRSYTGEDTVEISCHGGLLVQTRVLEGLFREGAEPAAPGEFTRRAYLSGQITLADAEAIGALIDAESDEELRLASRRSRSLFARRMQELCDRLVAELSELDALLDFPDEEPTDETAEGFALRFSGLCREIEGLAASYETGRAILGGVAGAIVGRPNVGKSSVYNRLVGEDAAIVTQIAGTTRDVLERRIRIGQVAVELADTAGVHETDDPVERIGVERSLARLAQAELILLVLDRSAPLGESDHELIGRVREEKGRTVLLLNKSDLPAAWGSEEIGDGFDYVIECSAETGAGFDLIAKAVDALMTDRALAIGESAIVTTARQRAALSDAQRELGDAVQALRAGIALDIAAAAAERALRALLRVEGREAGEEIADAIFSRFCVGK